MSPDYKGRIALNPTLLDAGRLEAMLETGTFELANTRVHQNLVLHHLGTSMRRSTIFLCEASHMVGSPYRPTALQEISWGDLRWMELPQHVALTPVQEEVVDTGGKGVITQWVHGELIVSFETIHLVNTHQVCVEYF